jgi:hypothetical protein
MCRTSKFLIICEGLCAENGACEAHADEVDGHCDESWWKKEYIEQLDL